MMKSRKFSSLAVILVAVFVLGAVLAGSVATKPEIASARAVGTLYGANGAGGKLANLYILNANTGAVIRNLGPIGYCVTGLAFHPRTGVLYGSTGANCRVAPGSLIKIIPGRGATLIGSLGYGTRPAADITFSPDGTLYGWLEWDFDDLVTIDLNTGRATIVGNSGLDTRGSGLAFLPKRYGGTLYFTPEEMTGHPWRGELYTVNPTTGRTTFVARLNTKRGHRIGALASDELGTLFGAMKLGGGGGKGRYALVTVNTTTGQVTTVGQTVRGLDGIAFQPEME